MMRCLILIAFALCTTGHGAVVFEKLSPYHHVQVRDAHGVRTLSFNGSMETQMSLSNPMRGHFEYIDYFHMPWVWNRNIKRVLMLGLGGGSVQRAYQHYYPDTILDTVELDPVVVEVARKYFGIAESPRHRIHTQDGRMFLTRTTNRYDTIIVDAYSTTRYGSSVPPHLTTEEFFELAKSRLTTNGVVAYNVIGTVRSSKRDIVGAIYRTMKEVFPQVYSFQADTCMNVVLIATKSPEPFDRSRFQKEGAALLHSGVVRMPTFTFRLRNFENSPPRSAAVSPVLTDDHAPVETLLPSLTGR